MTINFRLKLRAGGTLDLKRHIYIVRDADEELWRLLKDGEYANVLTSRQMGKSSLMMRTVHRLNAEGIHWSTIDLASEVADSSLTINSYYVGLLNKIIRDLELDLDLQSWWTQSSETSNQRFLRFFRDVVGRAISGPIVIFLY